MPTTTSTTTCCPSPLKTIATWLLYSSWPYLLFIFYLQWWENSKEFGTPKPSPSPPPRPNPERYPKTAWLTKRGYLYTRISAQRVFFFHLAMLVFEPVEGYWLLTTWWNLWLPAARTGLPCKGMGEGCLCLEDIFARFWCWVALVVGIIGLVIAGIVLVVDTVRHLDELWSLGWEEEWNGEENGTVGLGTLRDGDGENEKRNS